MRERCQSKILASYGARPHHPPKKWPLSESHGRNSTRRPGTNTVTTWPLLPGTACHRIDHWAESTADAERSTKRCRVFARSATQFSAKSQVAGRIFDFQGKYTQQDSNLQPSVP